MEGESPVEADDEEAEVVTQTDACAQGKLVEQSREAELHRVDGIRDPLVYFFSFITVFFPIVFDIAYVELPQTPYVTHVDEERSLEVAEERRAILQIAHDLQVAVAHRT